MQTTAYSATLILAPFDKTMPYLCPICTQPLELQSSTNSYACLNKHQFDIAKQGYLNLLPVQHKHSKQPGDNKEMMQARREFLEAGYYQALAEAIGKLISAIPTSGQALQFLDLGCGEGYYSRQLATYCAGRIDLAINGVDIAKIAIASAAKKQAQAKFTVASANRLPFADNYFDVILRVFAPSNALEIRRVLKPSGLLVTVTPGPRHLWQLKQFIYAEVKEHDSSSGLPDGFCAVSSERLHYSINPPKSLRLALLQMTPFAWRVSPQSRQTIQDTDPLSIETDFILTVSQKLSDA